MRYAVDYEHIYQFYMTSCLYVSKYNILHRVDLKLLRDLKI